MAARGQNKVKKDEQQEQASAAATTGRKATVTTVYRGVIYLPGDEIPVQDDDMLTPVLGGDAVPGRRRGLVAAQNETRQMVETQQQRYLMDPRNEGSGVPTETDALQQEAQLTGPVVENQQASSSSESSDTTPQKTEEGGDKKTDDKANDETNTTNG